MKIDNLKELRKSAGLTLAELAERTGLDETTIKRAERGSNVRHWTALKLQQALGCAFLSSVDTIGLRIRLARESAGLSAYMLGCKAGYSNTYISLIETGKVIPKPRMIEKIADAIGVSPDSLAPEFDRSELERLIGAATVSQYQNILNYAKSQMEV